MTKNLRYCRKCGIQYDFDRFKRCPGCYNANEGRGLEKIKKLNSKYRGHARPKFFNI